MQLRGIEFGPCWDAPGVRGWFGEGYPFHRLAPSWYDFSDSTRVAKTTTLLKNKGHMWLWGKWLDYTPINPFPLAVWCSWRRNIALNAIGLSGPGTQALLDAGLLTRSDAPFMISFMSIVPTREGRLEEFRRFCVIIRQTERGTAPFALQINISCPNTGLDPDELIDEALQMLDIGSSLHVPLIVKLNVLAPYSAAKAIAEHSECDALCITNTIPWGKLPEKVSWKKLFPHGSPLSKWRLPPGGLSGTILLPIVIDWVRGAKEYGIDTPLNVGGGITHPDDVDKVVHGAGLVRGHDSIFIGSVAILRPWNIPPVIDRTHVLLG